MSEDSTKYLPITKHFNTPLKKHYKQINANIVLGWLTDWLVVLFYGVSTILGSFNVKLSPFGLSLYVWFSLVLWHINYCRFI